MIRRTLIGVLLIVGIIGIALAIVQWRDADALLADRHHLTTNLIRAAAIAREIGAAQEAYVAPGQPDQPWFDRTRELAAELTSILNAIAGGRHTAGTAGLLLQARASLAQLVDADARIQATLLNGLDLSASDLIFTEARDAGSAMVSAVSAIDRAELDYFAARHAQWQLVHWTLLGGTAFLWAIAAMLWVKGHRQAAMATIQTEEPVGEDERRATTGNINTTPAVDLQQAADVCVQLSRIASVDALPGLLARAAQVLNATGVILWMGAGEELFPVTGYGYDQRTLARLGPIRRQARNATAATWRTGQPRTVNGDAETSGAVAAPLFGLDGCFGVLAAEFRNGHEANTAVAAVTAMFAAQLSTIVPAWPAPSDRREAGEEHPPMAASL